VAKTELFVRQQPGGVFSVVNQAVTTGNIFFVDSGSATGANSVGAGQNPDAPFLTIDYAVGQCTANNGDIIYVMPGHAEVVAAAAGLDLDVAGITIVGLGSGAVGMWSGSDPLSLLDTNEGYASRLIGSPETILARIAEFQAMGVDMLHLDLRDTLFQQAVLPRLQAL
jgi:hypothetical protein